MKKEKIMWVVCWEGTNIPKSKKDIVICFHPNKKGDTIGKLLEILYMMAMGSVKEKMAYAVNKKTLSPVFKYGGSKNNIIHCGHNPHLVAERKAVAY